VSRWWALSILGGASIGFAGDSRTALSGTSALPANTTIFFARGIVGGDMLRELSHAD
jgi:hypothetical protein